jgi:dihydroorotate dehydrogenase
MPGRRASLGDRALGLAPCLLRLLPPEAAHDLAIAGLRFAPRLRQDVPDGLEVDLAGLKLAHSLGLAAGFDKNARAIAGLLRLGFAFVEAGSVTPRPQPGNPRPRLFRLAEDAAIVNRMGFNNEGLEHFVAALVRRPTSGPDRGIVGANLGINKGCNDPERDYALGARAVLPHADYLAVNVSSPNTKGLRDLQERRALERVLEAVTGARHEHLVDGGAARPIFLKVAPDLDDAAALAIVEVAIERGIDGLIATNTTVARPPGLVSAARNEAGGLSGRPLMAPSTRLLGLMARHAGGRLAFIGVGGIASGDDAYAKVLAGATAVQLYTAFVYQGPAVIQRVLDGLAECLARDGHASLKAAIGAAL